MSNKADEIKARRAERKAKWAEIKALLKDNSDENRAKI